ncbi:serine hydrolase [Paenibacillus sp. LMG 31456]|uniref:Serine hydrolase n=1 Tax=Paenibacillus foliorum TaxID=2654974 RepID=A0A972GMD0_9BACL|nr:serine hydrolase [Paenibacillus foliorum]NOU92923.1 serine hydrolase [Paenibacillus foliorum]
MILKGLTSVKKLWIPIGIILVALLSFVTWAYLLPDKKTVPETSSVPWEGGKWRTSTPEEQGINSAELADVLKAVQSQHTNIHSLLIVRNGFLVLSTYFAPYREDDGVLYPVHSVTKSITSALTGIAINEGALKGTDQKVLNSLTEESKNNTDLNKAAITVKNLLMMQSGLDWPEGQVPYGNNNIVSQMMDSPNQVQFILNQPMSSAPGTAFNYDTGASHLLSAMIQKNIGKNLKEYAKEKLFGPLSITNFQWAADKQGVSYGGAGLQLTPEDMAKIGYLYSNKGMINRKQVIPATWISESTAMNNTTPNGYKYGYLWWGDRDYFFASGSYGQGIFVSPEKNLVVVMTSDILDASIGFLESNKLFSRIESSAVPEHALPVNAEGNQQMKEQVRQASSPKKPTPQLPVMANEISGRTYIGKKTNAGDENRAFTLTFSNKSDVAVFKKTLGAETVDISIGLDNEYRKTGDYKAKGYWDGDAFIINLHYVNPDFHTPYDYMFKFLFDKKEGSLEFQWQGGSEIVELISK